ncbi:MAG: hypothetical protein PUC15_08380 [Lentisphaeria bacterium]|nr:hypothetical protein [Lentisphaeria bacterium]
MYDEDFDPYEDERREEAARRRRERERRAWACASPGSFWYDSAEPYDEDEEDEEEVEA